MAGSPGGLIRYARFAPSPGRSGLGASLDGEGGGPHRAKTMGRMWLRRDHSRPCGAANRPPYQRKEGPRTGPAVAA